MAMIWSMNQRQSVMGVDCTLKHNQSLIYIAFYGLQTILPTLPDLFLTVVA